MMNRCVHVVLSSFYVLDAKSLLGYPIKKYGGGETKKF